MMHTLHATLRHASKCAEKGTSFDECYEQSTKKGMVERLIETWENVFIVCVCVGIPFHLNFPMCVFFSCLIFPCKISKLNENMDNRHAA